MYTTQFKLTSSGEKAVINQSYTSSHSNNLFFFEKVRIVKSSLLAL